MKPRIVAAALSAVVLSGCLSHEGPYLPGCIAYAGNKITLGNGRFVWEKFTDAVVINDDGEVVNQFPGYPMRGSYRIEEQTVNLQPDSGDQVPGMYLQQHENSFYLLTADEFSEWEKTGNYAGCTLRLAEKSES